MEQFLHHRQPYAHNEDKEDHNHAKNGIESEVRAETDGQIFYFSCSVDPFLGHHHMDRERRGGTRITHKSSGTTYCFHPLMYLTILLKWPYLVISILTNEDNLGDVGKLVQ